VNIRYCKIKSKNRGIKMKSENRLKEQLLELEEKLLKPEIRVLSNPEPNFSVL
jgi:hypothetical protein